MLDKLAAIEERYEELAREMARPEVAADYERLQALAREHASLEDTVSMYREYRSLADALEEARAIVAEGKDADLVELAQEEIGQAQVGIEALQEKLHRALIPKDPMDEKDVIVAASPSARAGRWRC
jgi:peptide chain release factor 1